MDERCIMLQIKSHPDNVSMVGLAVRGCCSLYMNELAAKEMELVIVEAINNVIEHGYQGDHHRDVLVYLNLSPIEFCAQIRDFGRAWDLKGKGGLPEIGDTHEDIPEGGFGLFFINQLMDHVELSAEIPGSTLLLRKNIQSSGSDNETP